jgi:dihydroorotase
MNRRQLIDAATAVAVASVLPERRLYAASYDLVIRGGRVIDPAQRLDRGLDVGIANGKIAALKRNIPASAAAEAIDADGLLVVPGLIDVHVHARDAELPPSEFLASGVTTMVDAGSRGADNVAQLVEVAERAPNRMRLLLNIGRLGNNPGGRAEFLDDLEQADVDKALRAVAEHRRYIVGIKARLSRGIAAERDLDVLRRARQVGDAANLPIMVHVGNTAHTLPEILALLRAGDIVTHMYAPVPNGILDASGIVLPEVRQARQRGVRFDFGNGLNEHWAWDVAERAMAQGFAPDTISSDLNVPGRTAQVFDLPNVLSKFLVLGMPLERVIACATQNAAATFAELRELGALRVGATADVTLLEAVRGNVEFVDNYKGMRTGEARLTTRGVLVAGKPAGAPPR